MPETSYEFLTKFFQQYLPFTPTSGQVEQFQSDLTLVSPFLMEASLVEVKNGRLGAAVAATSSYWRPALFAVYNRKVAEHALLFPVFHSFETAFRSTVAVHLERHYDHKRWWRKVYTELKAGRPANGVTQISGKPVAKDAAHAIGEIIYAIEGDSLQRGLLANCNNGYQFTECCDLSHISRLISTHWAVFAPLLTQNGQALSKAAFQAKFARVRDARNDVYHHKSIARMKDVVATAEELLDRLNFCLKFVYEKTMSANPTPLVFAIEPQSRHRIW